MGETASWQPLEAGRDYVTRGGWRARVIWRCRVPAYGGRGYVLAIHGPGTPAESGPVQHRDDGTALDVSPITFGRPPVYDLHPADIVGPWPSAPDRTPWAVDAVVTEDDGDDVPDLAPAEAS